MRSDGILNAVVDERHGRPVFAGFYEQTVDFGEAAARTSSDGKDAFVLQVQP